MGAGGRRLRSASRDLSLHPAKLSRTQIPSCPILVKTTAARSAASLSQRLSATGKFLSNGCETGTGWKNCPARQHFDVGGLAFRQRLQSNPSRRGGARVCQRHSWRSRSRRSEERRVGKE